MEKTDKTPTVTQSPVPAVPTKSPDASGNTPVPTGTPGSDVTAAPAPTGTPAAAETLAPTGTPDVAETPVPTETPGATVTPAPDDGNDNGKILVAYFSWSGTSERIAQNIIAQTGADSFRIERETPYSDDYNTVAYGGGKG